GGGGGVGKAGKKGGGRGAARPPPPGGGGEGGFGGGREERGGGGTYPALRLAATPPHPLASLATSPRKRGEVIVGRCGDQHKEPGFRAHALHPGYGSTNR